MRRDRAMLWLCGSWTGLAVLPHVVGLVGDLQNRSVGLKVLTGDVDTTTVTGRLVFGIFARPGEFERDLIHERTMAGLAAARARGRSVGRPRVMTKAKLKTAMTMMTDRDNAARDVATQLGISLSTLYAYVDAQGKPRPRSAELLGKRTRIPAANLKSA
jgi:DNA invertase Pin-like site-specific DNA recombinase